MRKNEAKPKVQGKIVRQSRTNKVEEDLIAEVQRLRAENAYFKN